MQNEDIGLAFAFVILLILSAFDITSKPAIWVGLFLLVIVWVSAYQTGALKSFGQELSSKPGSQ